MANAVQSGAISTVSDILDNVTSKGIQTINSWVRDYPELMYVGLYLPNFFKDGGKMQRGGLTFLQQQQLKFKNIGAIEADMTINKNEVVWYEVGAYSDRAEITVANVTADNTIDIAVGDLQYFAVGDVVAIRAKAGGTTPNAQAEITAINAATGEITLSTSVITAVGDSVMFAYNLITHKSEITRSIGDIKQIPVRVYFQKFGGSVEFDSQTINQSRLLLDAQEYVRSRFSITINTSNNTFANAFYLGRNIAGNRSETQGLETLIQEKEARDGVGSTIIDFSAVTVAKDKAKKLIETINLSASAPVYTGGENPTVYCNYEFINSLAEIMYDMGNHFTLQDKEIEFGITQYSSPYFKNIQFIVSNTLNKLEESKSVAYIFPKHLVSFRVPENLSVNEQGAMIKTPVGGYSVMKMPQTSVDFVKYTAQMTMANIFGGQTFKNTYKKIIGF